MSSPRPGTETPVSPSVSHQVIASRPPRVASALSDLLTWGPLMLQCLYLKTFSPKQLWLAGHDLMSLVPKKEL